MIVNFNQVNIQGTPTDYRGTGGGIVFYNTRPDFDRQKRCSIFMNDAPNGRDLSATNPVHVVLNIFTVLFPTSVEVHRIENFTFDIKEGYGLTTNFDQNITAILPNYPNPAKTNTRIQFGLTKKQLISLTIYNTLGQIIETVFEDKSFERGINMVEVDLSRFSSGTYIYVLKSADVVEGGKLVLLK